MIREQFIILAYRSHEEITFAKTRKAPNKWTNGSVVRCGLKTQNRRKENKFRISQRQETFSTG